MLPVILERLVERVVERAHARLVEQLEREAVGKDRSRGGPVELDTGRHEVKVRGEPVGLTPKEFELLELLLDRKGRLLVLSYAKDGILSQTPGVLTRIGRDGSRTVLASAGLSFPLVFMSW